MLLATPPPPSVEMDTSSAENGEGAGEIIVKAGRKKGKHDKPKPWDEDPNIDHWKVEKFDPLWNEGGLLEESSFSTLFPQYRGNFSLVLMQNLLFFLNFGIIFYDILWI